MTFGIALTAVSLWVLKVVAKKHSKSLHVEMRLR